MADQGKKVASASVDETTSFANERNGQDADEVVHRDDAQLDSQEGSFKANEEPPSLEHPLSSEAHVGYSGPSRLRVVRERFHGDTEGSEHQTVERFSDGNEETSATDSSEEEENYEEMENRVCRNALRNLERQKERLSTLQSAADKEVLALQYIPFVPNAGAQLPDSCRIAIIGVFQVLILQHLRLLATFFSLSLMPPVYKWGVTFLRNLAMILNLPMHVFKGLTRPMEYFGEILKEKSLVRACKQDRAKLLEEQQSSVMTDSLPRQQQSEQGSSKQNRSVPSRREVRLEKKGSNTSSASTNPVKHGAADKHAVASKDSMASNGTTSLRSMTGSSDSKALMGSRNRMNSEKTLGSEHVMDFSKDPEPKLGMNSSVSPRNDLTDSHPSDGETPTSRQIDYLRSETSKIDSLRRDTRNLIQYASGLSGVDESMYSVVSGEEDTSIGSGNSVSSPQFNRAGNDSIRHQDTSREGGGEAISRGNSAVVHDFSKPIKSRKKPLRQSTQTQTKPTYDMHCSKARLRLLHEFETMKEACVADPLIDMMVKYCRKCQPDTDAKFYAVRDKLYGSAPFSKPAQQSTKDLESLSSSPLGADASPKKSANTHLSGTKSSDCSVPNSKRADLEASGPDSSSLNRESASFESLNTQDISALFNSDRVKTCGAWADKSDEIDEKITAQNKLAESFLECGEDQTLFDAKHHDISSQAKLFEDENDSQPESAKAHSTPKHSPKDLSATPSNNALSVTVGLLPDRPPRHETVLLRDLVSSFILNGQFDARAQKIFSRFSECLGINELVLVRVEENIAADLIDALVSNKKRSKRLSKSSRWKIAGAAVGGGLLVAITAGLAAPAVATALGTLGVGSALTAFLGTASGTALMASLFGAGGAGLTGYKYSRRIACIKDFEFEPISDQGPGSLLVGVVVSGWLRSDSDIIMPWMVGMPRPRCDLYALRWEPDILKALGSTLLTMLSQDIAISAGKIWLQYTATAGLMFALMWPISLIQYAASLDNTWIVCRERAQQAGKLLADAISDKQAVGHRPVTLIGFSMGARTIFFCLQELHKRRVLHCVSDAILMGLPASVDRVQWMRAREVVSGRLVNVYSRSDWMLGFQYRYMEWGISVAGLRPVDVVPHIENYDVTGIIKNHGQYLERIGDILSFIGYDT